MKVWYSKLQPAKGFKGSEQAVQRGHDRLLGPLLKKFKQSLDTLHSIYGLFGGRKKASSPGLAVQDQMVKVRLVCIV